MGLIIVYLLVKKDKYMVKEIIMLIYLVEIFNKVINKINIKIIKNIKEQIQSHNFIKKILIKYILINYLFME